MELEKTDKTIGKLLEMARDLNARDGSCDWAAVFDIDDADDYLAGMNPSEIIRAVLFGDIEEGVGYFDAYMRFNDLGNIEFISSYSLEEETWDNRDEILENYKEEFGEDKLAECLNEMDKTTAIV